MALQPVHAPQPLMLVPPLLPPLVLRVENGFFGAKRPAIGNFGDCEPCTRFEEPPSRPPDEEDPGDEAPGDQDPDDQDPGGARPSARYVKHQVHEAVDLEGEAGDCVFAAYTGRVVEVERGATGVRGNLTIDHHPSGTGLVSRYLHLDGDSICVEPGQPVTKGDLIGQIGSGPSDPHLHFELRIVVDPSDRRFWSDRNSVALDPTRLLYRFEAAALPLLRSGGPAAVTRIGIQEAGPVAFFRAQTDASPRPYSIPLYEPTTEHERGLIDLFTKALELGRPVEVEFRDSVFFGDNRVPASVVLT
jgi:Peptidase family M23